MSFVFHPTVLRGTRPNLVLRELNQFAYQLDQSPIMNALFSPSTVPIPPTSPAWPSKFEAQKYLPPNHPQARKNPQLRRTVMQINVNDLNPKTFEQLHNDPAKTIAEIIQETLAKNSAAFSDAMKKSLNFPSQQQVSQPFESRSNAMNQFFNNQLQVPQFPTFPSFNQLQFQGNPSQAYPQFQIPQLQFPQIPYISPSLRNHGIDPTGDIDVRLDKRPDSLVHDGNRTNNDLQTGTSVIQIGSGNKNFGSNDNVLVEANDSELDEKLKEISSMNNRFDEQENRENVDDSELLEPDVEAKDEEYGDPSNVDVIDSNPDKAQQLDEQMENLNEDNPSQPFADEVEKVESLSDDALDKLPVAEIDKDQETEANDLKLEDFENDSTPSDGLQVMNQLRENATDKPTINSTMMENEKLKATTLPPATIKFEILSRDSESTTELQANDEPTTEKSLSTTTEKTAKPTTSATATKKTPTMTQMSSISTETPTTDAPDTTAAPDDETTQLVLATTLPSEEATTTKCLGEDFPETTTESTEETTNSLDSRLGLNAVKTLVG